MVAALPVDLAMHGMAIWRLSVLSTNWEIGG